MRWSIYTRIFKVLASDIVKLQHATDIMPLAHSVKYIYYSDLKTKQKTKLDTLKTEHQPEIANPLKATPTHRRINALM